MTAILAEKNIYQRKRHYPDYTDHSLNHTQSLQIFPCHTITIFIIKKYIQKVENNDLCIGKEADTRGSK